jgi:Uma2 family endonuclease
MTAEELLRLPRGRFRHELIRGELRVRPLAGVEEGDVAAHILWSLMSPRRGGVYAGVGFQLSKNPDTVRSPTVAFVLPQRVVKTQKFFEGPPDLAIEVVSPGGSYTEVGSERRAFDQKYELTPSVFIRRMSS